MTHRSIPLSSFLCPPLWSLLTRVPSDTVPVTLGISNVPLSSSLPTVLWLTLYVPQAGTTPGARANVNLVLTVGSNTITIPVRLRKSYYLGVITRSQVALYVYNFVLKKTPHFKTAMFGLPTRCPPPPGCPTIDQLDPWKQVYLEHRLTPNYPAWPNGLSTSTRIGMSARLTCARFRCRRVVV